MLRVLDELDFGLRSQAPAHHLILSHQILACQRGALISFQSNAQLKMHCSRRLTLTVRSSMFVYCEFTRMHLSHYTAREIASTSKSRSMMGYENPEALPVFMNPSYTYIPANLQLSLGIQTETRQLR